MKIKYLIDTHQHYGYWNTLTECKYNLLNSFTKYNLSYALISFDGSEFKEEGQKRGKLVPSLEGSKKMLKFVKENEHYGMLVWVRPHTENNVQEIESFIKKHLNLIHGIKFHPYCSRMRVTDKRFEPYILIARKYMKKYLQKNPPINEQMIKAMMSGMGRTPSQKQVNQMMKQMNKFM